MLETFRLAKFRFTVCAKEHIRFPSYKGSAFRGGFGYAFKRVVCVIRDKECDDCLLKQKCIYSYIFETPPPQDTEMLRLYPKVPHPFVIEPPITEKQNFEPGETFSFHLILIGNAIDYLPYFIYTFTELGKQGIGQGRGKYDLLQVEGMDLGNEAIQIYDHKTQTLTNHYPIIHARQLNHQPLTARLSSCVGENIATHNQIPPPCEGEDFVVSAQPNVEGGGKNSATISSCKWGKETLKVDNHTNHLTISLLTPLRLRFDGHITDKIEFHVLIRNLLRRISSLSYFHCGEKFQVNFKGLIEKAKAVNQIKSDIHWYDWKRYSTRQEEWMSLGGVTGTVSYEGDISDFMLLLRLGEYVHVGKGTSFGLGRYEIL
ncbi:MAG TPA: CRISPR system precrRNA processing endoribonuclease RAMP protein Cas6 [Candidatus Wunengus sp. YC63]|uniref:CRISPR system precrRNA processing endoribonuclease RAMP protein Cas6 n=1 Tax=Candidatus Wunengus sp. YC63 TaxID=3367699 RepID=UPI0040265B15